MTNVAVELVHTDDDDDERRRRRRDTQRQTIGALLFVGALFALLSAKPAEVRDDNPPPQSTTNTATAPPSTNTNVVTTPATPPTPVAVDPASLDFGAMNVGTSKTQPITFMNPGNSEFVTTAIASGLAPTDFTIAADQCARIAPNEMCVATVAFAPRSAGPQTATFTLRSESNASLPVQVSGSGVALAGLLEFATPEIGLGSHRIGVASRQPFTIANRGNSPLTVTGITSSDSQFEAMGCVNTAIAPGATCDGLVVFRPQSRGKIDATLTATDDTGKTASTALTGGGILHMLSTTTPQLDLPQNQGRVGTATFANTGDDAVTIAGPAQIKGGDFFGTADGSSDGCLRRGVLQPGDTCDIDIYSRGDSGTGTLIVSGDGVQATAVLRTVPRPKDNEVPKRKPLKIAPLRDFIKQQTRTPAPAPQPQPQPQQVIR